MRTPGKIGCITLALCCLGTGSLAQATDQQISTASAPAQTSTASVPAQTSTASVPAQTTTGVDNSRVNKRDKNGATLTPQDQSNHKGDRQLLAAVRRAVIHDKALSTSAHNVKIVVASGVVTLRGPVNSDDEKSSVEKIATQVGGVTRVDNQLDVKSK